MISLTFPVPAFWAAVALLLFILLQTARAAYWKGRASAYDGTDASTKPAGYWKGKYKAFYVESCDHQDDLRAEIDHLRSLHLRATTKPVLVPQTASEIEAPPEF